MAEEIHRVLAVVNQKGGVGKTTTAINLAAAFAHHDYSTLLVDCDPQANTTSGLGFARGEERNTVYDVLLGNCSVAAAIAQTGIPHLSLIPGTRDMIGANLELVGADRREFRLRDAVAEARPQFQFILLDCPPALDLLTLNALVAADRLLVPMQAEYFALEGVSELMSTADRVEALFNPGLGLEGVLLTMYDDRTNLSQQVRQNLAEFFGDKLLQTTIPRNIRLAEAPSHGKPAILYDPRSRGAEAYFELAEELLTRSGQKVPSRERRKLIVDSIPSPQFLPQENEKKPNRFWPFR